MKKVWATVLAGCLALQSLSGYALTAQGAESELLVTADSVDVMADGNTETENAGGEETASGSLQAEPAQAEAGELPPSEPDEPAQQEAGEPPLPDAEVTQQPGTEELPLPEADVTQQTDPGEIPLPGTEETPEPETAGASSDSGLGSGTLQESTTEPSSGDMAAQMPGGEETSDPTADAELPEEDGLLFDDLLAGDTGILEDIVVIDDVQGEEPESGLDLETETESESETESDLEAEPELETESDALQEYQVLSLAEWNNSYIEVKVVSTLPFLDNEKIDISISAPAAQTETVYIPDAGTTSATKKFSVAPGTYTVTVSADRFADFHQEVRVGAQQTARIEVCTSRVRSLSADGTGVISATSGWLRLGDADGDRDVDNDDIQAIVAAVHADSTEPACDLNEDGLVDLVDLQLALQSLGQEQPATVSILSVPREVKSDENTKINEDEVRNLLDDKGSVKLRPADGGAITEENPVSMTFDFEAPSLQGQSLPELGGMTIQVPVEKNQSTGEVTSDITNGYALVEASDGTFYKIPLGMQVAQEIRTASAGEGTLRPLMLLTAGAPLEILPVESIEEIGEGEISQEILAVEEQAADNGVAELIPADAAPPATETSGMTPEARILAEENAEALPAASLEPDGSFVLNFGKQIAVKRVTIRITGTTQKEDPLAEIARVQFVNDMESRIPAPDLSIPEITEIKSKNEELVVSWKEQTNVTGYEVEVTGPVKKGTGELTQTVRVGGSPHTVVSISDKSLMNYRDYKIRVRSVNGEWSSPWSQTGTAQPKPESGPGRVDNVVAKGGYRSIHVTWKDMDDANGYMLYYRVKNTGDFLPAVPGFVQSSDGAGRLMTNQYTITGLDDATMYEVYVVSWNDFELGTWGQERSRLSEAMTESGETPKLPKYYLLNTYNGTYDDKAEEAFGRLTDHIVSAVCGTHNGQKMVESPLDQAADAGGIPSVNGAARKYARWAYGTVDNNYASYWTKTDWDDGVSYPVSDFSKGITVTFDGTYKMNYLTFTAADMKGNPETARIVYWENPADGKGEEVGCSVIRNLDDTKRPYYVVKFDRTVEARQIQLYIGTSYSKIDLKIGEIHFHKYNEQVDGAVEALFADAEHSTLSTKLTSVDLEAAKAVINEAEALVNAPDEATGEYHPLRAFLLLDIEAARELLELKLDEPVRVDPGITARKDGHINFGGLNEWQPLGRVAASGEALTVYVGHNFKSIRENTNLQLIFTQYHAESSTLAKSISLKVGANKITLPEITTNSEHERGGQLYVAYTGNNPSDQYVVRINGGVKIPVLNLHNKTGEAKQSAISTYISELQEYTGKLQELHQEKHAGSENSYVNQLSYDERNCILNATDLMMDHMMYSVPATQVLAGLAGRDDKAAALGDALDAIEKTMTLFYQHKGLFRGAGGNRETPSRHLNIRYMQMFTGAFMYASGNHIGVEFNETKLVAAASWDSFGWGVAHEIGHDINDPNYAIAEITNNYFAQLLTKAANAEHKTRFNYEDVYRKVTSGAVGRSPNGAVQLALYWQLHLAFDDCTVPYGDDSYRDDRVIFDNYQTMFDNLFFARVDTYSRNPGAAPKNPDKTQAVELKLVKDIDQNLMRLSCAAAKANILPFFERWGMTPDEDTRKFAGQYGGPTEKALYYVNDDARNYRADHKGEEETQNVRNASVKVTIDPADGSHVNLRMELEDFENKDAILGYEVSRSMYTNGKKQPAVVIGFQPAGEDGSATYTDTISALDNRVLYYEVRAVDKFLNYSPVKEAGRARISTKGALGKHSWTVETTLVSEDDKDAEYNDNDPDAGYGDDIVGAGRVYSIGRIIDSDFANPYVGRIPEEETEGQIVVDMRKPMEVTSVNYTGGALNDVTISVSLDGNVWTTVKEKYQIPDSPESHSSMIWFDAVQAAEKGHWIGTYDARYVKFAIGAENSAVKINEIDICGPTGDDISFFSIEGAEEKLPAVGITEADYRYASDESGDLTIPAGSLLFAGSYKGNPAYNVVVLYDAKGNVVGADLETKEVNSEQVIFAEVPADGHLGTTSNGIWVYYVTPRTDDPGYIRRIYEGIAAADDTGSRSVRAELYRVDKAHTLEGERVVSDTEFITLPEFGSLKTIKLDDELKKAGQQSQTE